MIEDVIAWLPHLLALAVVFIAMPLNWFVTVLLWRIANADPFGLALRTMAAASTSVALIVTVFGLVFINNGMAEPVLRGRDTQLVTRSALLFLSVIPAIFWLRWYRRNDR